jgi:cytochrome P450
MAATLFYLSHYPTCYNTLAAEVRSAFSTAEEIRIGPNLNKCVYLRACIDETLRISPSASSALWREVLPGGITADAHFIPAGYDIGISIYALHHNPTYYPDPHRYMPERWLRVYGGAEPPVKAYFPFSIGPRGCVGKSLAMMELMLTIATVMWTYDFENVDGVVVGDEGGEKVLADEYQLKDHVTAAKDGPVLRFRLRQ